MNVLIKTSDAIAIFGNKTRIGKAIGITRQAVAQWGEYVPEESAAKLALKRPDIPYQISCNKKPLANANS